MLVMSSPIFTGFKYSSVFENMKKTQVWRKLLNYTFFVYMFNIEKSNLIGITTVSYPAIFFVPVIIIFTFLVSILGAFIVERIKILRNILMLH